MFLSMLLSRGAAGTQDQTEGAGEYRGKNNRYSVQEISGISALL